MKTSITTIGLLAGALFLFTGCGHRSLYFGTATVVGAEVSGVTTAPSKVAIAYDRAEVALIPAKATGESYAVYGGFDYDFAWGQRTLVLSQVFATGHAAVLASGPQQNTAPKDTSSNQNGRIFFATGTRNGLSLDLGQNLGQSVPSFLFGLKRSEVVVLPVADNTQEVNSVYADLSVVADNDGRVRAAPKDDEGDGLRQRDTIAAERLPQAKNGVRIVQRFATGQAALNVANSTIAREKLAEAAGITLADSLNSMQEGQAWAEQLKTKITDPAQQAALLKELDEARVFEFGKPDWNAFITSIPAYVGTTRGATIKQVSRKYLLQ